MEQQTVHELVRNIFSRQKLRQLCVNTALANFVGYVAGSLVMMLTTYHSVERRAAKNLFGILPRHTVVVHRLPEWVEWTLCVLLGYLVMETVRYVMRRIGQGWLIDGTARDSARDEAPPNRECEASGGNRKAQATDGLVEIGAGGPGRAGARAAGAATWGAGELKTWKSGS